MFEYVEHPLITEPCLYIVDPPDRVGWPHLQSLFSSCGPVKYGFGGKITVEGLDFQSRKIVFSDVYHAEMALATLSGADIPGVVPPWPADLRASLNRTLIPSEKPVLPIAIALKREWAMSQKNVAQLIFKWFRQAGPVLRVHIGVDNGHEHQVCLVEYYEPEHQLVAREAGVKIHRDAIHALQPPFRTIDLWKLYCTGLQPNVTVADVYGQFSKFGAVTNVSIVRTKPNVASAIVVFSEVSSASAAMQITRSERPWGPKAVIRYLNPDMDEGSGYYTSAKPPTNANSTTRSSGQQGAARSFTTEPHISAKQRETVNLGEGRARTKAEAIRIAQAKLKDAQHAETMARVDSDTAQAVEACLSDNLPSAESHAQEREHQYLLAKSAFEEAARLLTEAVQRMDVARGSFSEASLLFENATRDKQKATNEFKEAQKRRMVAEDAALQAQQAREAAEAELRAAERFGSEDEDEQARRKEIEESIRKLSKLRRQEEVDRQKREVERREAELDEARRRAAEREAEERERERAIKERKAREEEARRAEEERKRQEEEEAERKEREERREKEWRDAEKKARQKAYQEASSMEKARCNARDQSLGKPTSWNASKSLKRFKLVSSEFDDIKFCATQPLTFESVPWPILKSPFAASLADVEWRAVERFFETVRPMVNEEEYRIMVEKAHRRFHPDKWSARRLLDTVLDESLRQQLEPAVNVVSQALGPIWTKLRAH